jgi:hypothetical protein
MRINAISFVYAARFVRPQKETGQDHIKGNLFSPQAGGFVRLVATNGRCAIIVHDGAIQVETARKTWIGPLENGLLSAAKKGDFVTIRPDGVVAVERDGAVIYVSPASCEHLDRAYNFPRYDQVFAARLAPKTNNYSLNAKYLEGFDLGYGVSIYPAGGNVDPLIAQPILRDYSLRIQSAIGALMPKRLGESSDYTLSEDLIKTFLNRDVVVPPVCAR